MSRIICREAALLFALPWLAVVCLAAPASPGTSTLAVALSGKPGPYTLERWKRDWPGCAFQGGISDGRVELIKEGSTRWLRVNFAVGGIGPERGGAGWRWPIGRREAAELRYRARFSPDFDFVKGGKLPGLCGGPENVSGGRPANGTNGFSARLMWRKEGRGEAYVYHKNQTSDYGDSFPFPPEFRFPTGAPFEVRLVTFMNTPGQRDGALKVWITLPGQPMQLLVDRADLEWRSQHTFGVDGLYFETFHGGGDSSWSPTRPCWADFSQMEVLPPVAE